MKYEDLAFVNQQLSSLLRQGMPLEGGLRQVCAEMKKGVLRRELDAMEKDLAEGTPLSEAVGKRKFPSFYAQMLKIGIQSGDLVGVLVLLTDYYQRANSLWQRLKGLMVYPVFILAAAMVVSCIVSFSALTIASIGFGSINGISIKAPWMLSSMMPPVLFAAMLGASVCILFLPACQRKLRWHVPLFKEAALSQAGSTIGLMLRKGCSLKDTLAMVQQLERGTIAAEELDRWQKNLAEGNGKLSQFARPGRAFSPLFLWLASNAGEDLAAGFEKAGEVYYERAMRRAEIFLYSVLPACTLLLGAMIVAQMLPALLYLRQMLDVLGMEN